jgi:hypothetical protein
MIIHFKTNEKKHPRFKKLTQFKCFYLSKFYVIMYIVKKFFNLFINFIFSY